MMGQGSPHSANLVYMFILTLSSAAPGESSAGLTVTSNAYGT